MFDRLLDRAIKITIVLCLFSFILLLSGFNPYSIKRNITVELPRPVIYTVERVQPQREILIINEKEFECLRTNIFFEARNQSIQAQQAVALVTLNRVASPIYPDTICEVIKEYKQFSWYWDGKSDKPNLSNPIEKRAWIRATEVALDTLSGRVENFLGQGVTHYHADYVTPAFSKHKRYQRIAVIQKHIFYRDTKDTGNWLDNPLMAAL